jgi:hypothetical protein
MIYNAKKNAMWGLKNSGTDITDNILRIIVNAQSYLIIGGYNFSFGKNYMGIFTELSKKKIPKLMIIPSRLYGAKNPQNEIIRFCIKQNIGVILNSNNHSKWIVSEADLYYGSSNFSKTSWKSKIEVVNFNYGLNYFYDLNSRTREDFLQFVKKEIFDFQNRHSKYNTIRIKNLALHTWRSIDKKIQKLNPDIQKVRNTLENYEDVLADLLSVSDEAFASNEYKVFQSISNSTRRIIDSIEVLCRYAYNEILNETNFENENYDLDEKIAEKYNFYHSKFLERIEKEIFYLDNLEINKEVADNTDILKKNSELIEIIQTETNKYNGD